MIRLTLLALTATLATFAPAFAQPRPRPPGPPPGGFRPPPAPNYRYGYGSPYGVGLPIGVGVGVVRGPGFSGTYAGVGVGGPGYFGYYPGVYNGFYTNGLSAYGPPIPTRAPIAGVFGAADDRFYGLGSGYSFPRENYDPRDAVFFERAQPPPVQANEPSLAEGQLAARATVATIDVRMPDASATLTFDNQPTQSTGVSRAFTTPALLHGQVYRYTLVARWTEGVTPVVRTRTVTVQAGQRVTVDFAQPDGEFARQ